MTIQPSKQFRDDLQKLKREDVKFTYKTWELIFDSIDAIELHSNPLYGRGHVEPLGENLSGCYSRQISEKHRLVYRYSESKDILMLLSCYGHYE
jgi:toxin YoeB